VSLAIRAGQWSDKGRKPFNQDFHGLCVPAGPQLATKGIAVVLADGISSSEVSQLASQAAVRSFLDDYYCTSDAWSVKTSVERVLAAVNSWLHAQNQRGPGRYDKDRGWVCTLGAMVIKSRTAHLFHVGDTRIYQLHGKALEQLTQDHRLHVGGGQSYLARALGVHGHLEIDHHTVALAEGDTFLLATDGVYEHVPEAVLADAIERHGDALEAAAREIADEAVSRGSPDNVTVQIVRVETLPDPQAHEVTRLASALPCPPMLEPRMLIDGYRIVRELHASSRSHIHLAIDEASGEAVVIKTPSIDLRGDRAYLERFLLEEWVARRIASPHVLKLRMARAPSFLYVVFEYVEGCTLAQWMLDHPRADIATVRGLVEQVARGLRAFHRLEMLHQDLRPENIMVDATRTVKLIDFGAVRVAGLMEMAPERGDEPLGTAAYTAPECLLGQPGTARSDQFSLAVIAYQMLTGRLPFGTDVARCRSVAELKRLKYRSAQPANPKLPSWVDDAMQKALQLEPHKRYGDVDEFVAALHRPDAEFVRSRRLPLIERNPLVFWKALSAVLAVACLVLLAK
jgi:serine/threonine protein phosphatase PrpC